jgi:hypothetical protein
MTEHIPQRVKMDLDISEMMQLAKHHWDVAMSIPKKNYGVIDELIQNTWPK